MGLFFWNKRSKGGLNTAVKYFEQAIEKIRATHLHTPDWLTLIS